MEELDGNTLFVAILAQVSLQANRDFRGLVNPHFSTTSVEASTSNVVGPLLHSERIEVQIGDSLRGRYSRVGSFASSRKSSTADCGSRTDYSIGNDTEHREQGDPLRTSS